jgi:hypothetical protein
VTYIAQGLAGDRSSGNGRPRPVPDHETLIEIPQDVLKMYARRYQQEEADN